MNMSGLVVTACCIIIAIWDLIAVKQWGVQYSVSWYIRQTGITHPSIIFATGFLCGHFWAAMNPPTVTADNTTAKGNAIGKTD